ncbi:hypothetical protein [Pseudomonas sp. HN2-3]|uniref:hypothetical protein n=1 Tax=Pseudomonas sp. HN2-3 TaxID=2886360 RepID=UPI001D11B5E4|nr:hypothetical protein [Pseudomonas sp. HN2-3]UDU80107.1 hypothetical protein LJX93_20270 [Pseudomonas sp. HN2-3]
MSEQANSSEQPLAQGQESLVVVSIPQQLSLEQMATVQAQLQVRAEQMVLQLLAQEGGAIAHMYPSLSELLAEQRRQSLLLEQISIQNLALIKALAGEQGVSDDEPPST